MSERDRPLRLAIYRQLAAIDAEARLRHRQDWRMRQLIIAVVLFSILVLACETFAQGVFRERTRVRIRGLAPGAAVRPLPRDPRATIEEMFRSEKRIVAVPRQTRITTFVSPPRGGNLLERSCVSCHSGLAPMAGLDLSGDVPELTRWHSYARVVLGEMPPVDEGGPLPPADARWFFDWADAARNQERPIYEESPGPNRRGRAGVLD